MASKYTRDEVIQGRKCGLKYVDQAVANVGMAKLLDVTVEYHKLFSDTWPGNNGWANIDWAFGNAARERSNGKGEIAMTFNLDEALSPQDMAFIAEKTGLKLEEYVPGWGRKPSTGPVSSPTSAPVSTGAKLTSEQCVEYLLKSKLFQEMATPEGTKLDKNGEDYRNTEDPDFQRNPKNWKRVYKVVVKTADQAYDSDFALGSALEDVELMERKGLGEGILKTPCTVRVFQLKDSDYWWMYVITNVEDTEFIGMAERTD